MRNCDIDSRIPERVSLLMERLFGAGEDVYVVGGSLRDIMLGIEPHDFDLATSAAPQKTLSLFSDMRVIETGLKHGTVTVISEGEPVEITTFRIDGGYTDSRHPDRVSFTSSIGEDLSRRDFTVNAMAYNRRAGLVDLFGGCYDLESGLIRAVGDPRLRFSEDALRIMRAFRFSAQLGFDIQGDTLSAISEVRGGLANIAKERIASELLRMLTSPAPSDAIRKMIDTGVMPYVSGSYLPEREIVARIDGMPREDVARLGFFFSGANEEQAREALRLLKYSNKIITGSLAVARGAHHRVVTEADARRLISLCGTYAPYAAEASVLLGNSPPSAVGYVRGNTSACTVSSLCVSGKELCDIGIRGRSVGRTLELLLEAVIEEPELNEKGRLLEMARNINEKELE